MVSFENVKKTAQKLTLILVAETESECVFFGKTVLTEVLLCVIIIP